MGTEQLLVGNVAVAAILIKAILSSFKKMYPVKILYIQLATVVLGIGAAFALDIQLIETVDPSAFSTIMQTVLAGLFVASSSIGVHETSKVIKPNAK